MHVVIVDDEQWIVAGLNKILTRQYPDMRVSAFTDPLAAEMFMNTCLPDLLITDIRMPQLSGLELIARMRDAGLRHYAVLTGLNDVHLLQESIRIQVTDYLIKPVSKAELFALIDRVTQSLARLRQEDEAHLTDQLRLCAQYGAQAADTSGMEGYRTMLLSRADALLPEETARRFPVRVQLSHNGAEYALYLSGEENPPLGEALPESVVCAPFMPEALQQRVRDFDCSQKDEISLLASRFAKGQESEAAARLWELVHTGSLAPEALTRFARLSGRRLMLWDACSLAERAVRGLLSIQELTELVQSLAPLPVPRSGDVAEVLSWLEQHYREEITLAQAAASVYLQANYFTTLFRRETGVGFVQYLNQYRVEEACRMILHASDTSFAQIAQDTGFPSQRHFFATFKKYTGRTPGAFRQQLEEAGLLCTGSHRVQTVP